jgi:hypothetical protein
MITTSTPMPTISMVLRQPYCWISQAVSGDKVSGAIPIPAETRETASPSCLSNHNVVVAMIGAKKAPPAAPIRTP